ncbi:DUF308 domain-containing protein [Loigolactobacillus iwatensis]|uniref:DUF308 domain-containing protein n=1 Tax=Loigolactobacillus iwatensis TaxID=1267156 RepID=UPI000F7EEE2E|nr:DUF308 domain-containing protein [Loigolactobacillus iwatensis]
MSNSFKKNRVLQTLLAIVAGVALIIWPHPIFKIVIYLIALYLVYLGVIALWAARKEFKQSGRYGNQRTSGIVLCLAALFVLIFAPGLVSMLPFLMGIIILIYGISHLIGVLNHRHFVNVSRFPEIIYSAVIIIVGGFLLFNPFRSVLFGLQIFGVSLVVIGCRELVETIRNR